MLPRFAYILKLNNLGSVFEYKVDVDARFLYFFVALSASISGWQHCRPIISIDGTSLKNKYGDILLSASTPNVNDQIFPLVFYVVDSENDFSWTWFCNKLKKIISGRNEVVIGSDRHKSICTTIKNVKLKYKRIVNTVFHACGKTFNIVDFEYEMRWNLLPQVYVRSFNPLVLLSGLVPTHHVKDIMS
ncbi:protein FAR-RED ELONGATED HYPOCOTYL 3-like [Cucumis melo var. makuwa]|uniref:Protein FAR-RED ELONGATED HYPOCOTYL 3-like n=1 Tax=Cucumis melo var. makuwa TaxID=1194695 RepID=A0A5D3DBV9_CUCMM|nr:protein FAR-RED ELONGATED HYPOCOTYL 3-like [Cucumis melo var. makuwa]TYK21046.1 protein FAR-RED ELONGATED HYPOCOTYL 3-like [Cucumis melo var. makuwa]